MSATPTIAALRRDLATMAERDEPAPRAFFVDELEDRLSAMMRGAADGDLFPDIVVTRVEKARRSHRSVAASIAGAVVLMTAGVGALQQSSLSVGLGTRDDRAAMAASPADPGEAVVDAGANGSGAGRASDEATGSTAVPGGALDTPREATPSDARPITVWPHIDEQALAEATGGPNEPASMELRGSGTPASAWLEWERYTGDDFAAYLVLRAAAPDTPDYPDESGATMVLLRIESRDHVQHRDTGKVGTTPRYRVVAVDREGTVVARSGVFESDVTTATDRISHLPQPPTS